MGEVEFQIRERGVGILTINRPQVRNALNWEAMRGFADAVERAQEAPDLRALVVTGAGTAFISGGDLAELGDYPSRADGLRLATLMGDALSRLEALPCPTIAAINGPPRGGGAEVAVACDQRIMAEDADIGFVHIRLGLITAWGGGQRLLRTVGYSTAIELMTKGRVLSAREALSLRLTDRVAPMGQALLAARDLAGQVAENPPPAVRAAKRVLRVSLVADEGMAMEAERNEFPDLWDTDWRREAVAHFLSRSR